MSKPGALEDRFCVPPNWQWHWLDRGSRRLRYGLAEAESPRALIVILPGLSEFCEKYFETARDLLAHGYSVAVLDWVSQGLSSRLLEDPHKRHGLDFQHDIDDLAALLDHLPDNAPKVMLGHSMGGNIGLRYMLQNPGDFIAAGFSAPMVGIYALRHVPFARRLTSWLASISPEGYAPGGGPWRIDVRNENTNPRLFSSDPVRAAIHNYWCLENPDVQVGGITYSWLDYAQRSCEALQSAHLSDLSLPCLFATAGHEYFVDNTSIKKFAHRMPGARLINLPEARHEILMERDGMRDVFLMEFLETVRYSLDRKKE